MSQFQERLLCELLAGSQTERTTQSETKFRVSQFICSRGISVDLSLAFHVMIVMAREERIPRSLSLSGAGTCSEREPLTCFPKCSGRIQCRCAVVEALSAHDRLASELSERPLLDKLACCFIFAALSIEGLDACLCRKQGQEASRAGAGVGAGRRKRSRARKHSR